MKCELCGTQFRITQVGRTYLCYECEKDYSARKFGLVRS